MSFISSLADIFKTDKGKKKVVTEQSGAVLESLLDIKAFQDIEEEYPADKRTSIEKLETMENDENISIANDFFTFIVLQLLGIDNYYHEDEKIVELVNDSIENMSGSFRSHIRDLTKKGNYWGYSAAQMVLEVVDGRYLLAWMVNYKSQDVTFRVAHNDNGKEFISHVVIDGEEYPNTNFIHFSFGDLSSIYGFGRGNLLEKYYDKKLLSLKLWCIFLQKFTIPTIIAKTLGDVKFFVTRIKRWMYNNIIGLTKDREDVTLIERKAGVDPSKIYRDSIEFDNKTIDKVFYLLPTLMSGESGGAFALSKSQFNMLMQAAGEMAEYVRDSILIAQIFAPIIDYNYGKQLDYGEFRPQKIANIEELLQLMTVYEKGINTGLIDAELDNPWIRADMNFPEAPEGLIMENKLNEGVLNASKKNAEIKKEESEDNLKDKETN